VNAKCVTTERKFSVDEENLDELLLAFDDKITKLYDILTAKVDGKFVVGKKDYVTDYIQELLTKVDAMIKALEEGAPTATYSIKSDVIGDSPKTLLQVLTILSKEVDALKRNNNLTTSNLYLPNV
jgi:hypothetical protein